MDPNSLHNSELTEAHHHTFVSQSLLERFEEYAEAQQLTLFCGSWNVNAKFPKDSHKGDGKNGTGNGNGKGKGKGGCDGDGLRDWLWSGSSGAGGMGGGGVGMGIRGTGMGSGTRAGAGTGTDTSSSHTQNPPTPPDIVVISLQEIVGLNAFNSLLTSSATHDCATRWVNKLQWALEHPPENHDISKNPDGTGAGVEGYGSRNWAGAVGADGSEGAGAGAGKLSYVLKCQKSMVGLLLCVFAIAPLSPHITSLRFALTYTGNLGLSGNKGGVAISMNIYDTSVCFMGAHFHAHQDNVEQRNLDFQLIRDNGEFLTYEGHEGEGFLTNEGYETRARVEGEAEGAEEGEGEEGDRYSVDSEDDYFPTPPSSPTPSSSSSAPPTHASSSSSAPPSAPSSFSVPPSSFSAPPSSSSSASSEHNRGTVPMVPKKVPRPSWLRSLFSTADATGAVTGAGAEAEDGTKHSQESEKSEEERREGEGRSQRSAKAAAASAAAVAAAGLAVQAARHGYRHSVEGGVEERVQGQGMGIQGHNATPIPHRPHTQPHPPLQPNPPPPFNPPLHPRLHSHTYTPQPHPHPDPHTSGSTRVDAHTSGSTRLLNPLSHDLLFLLGDLNYRIDIDLPIADMVALIDDHNLKTQMTQNKHTPKNQQITTENPIKTHINTRHPIKTHLAIMAACDQLSRERKKGVFEGFSEGPLNFPPTYKFIPGTEEYDQRAEKKMRVPAWCDRVLWRSHRNTDVSQLLYCSHPLRLSDHKPILALFSINTYRVDDSKLKIVHQDLLRKVDRLIAEATPRVEISSREVAFGAVGLDFEYQREISVTNTSAVRAEWGFVPKNDETEVSPPWLRLSPPQGILAPGESATVTLCLLLSLQMAYGAVSSNLLEDVVVLRVAGGSDHFLPTSAQLNASTCEKAWRMHAKMNVNVNTNK